MSCWRTRSWWCRQGVRRFARRICWCLPTFASTARFHACRARFDHGGRIWSSSPAPAHDLIGRWQGRRLSRHHPASPAADASPGWPRRPAAPALASGGQPAADASPGKPSHRNPVAAEAPALSWAGPAPRPIAQVPGRGGASLPGPAARHRAAGPAAGRGRRKLAQHSPGRRSNGPGAACAGGSRRLALSQIRPQLTAVIGRRGSGQQQLLRACSQR